MSKASGFSGGANDLALTLARAQPYTGYVLCDDASAVDARNRMLTGLLKLLTFPVSGPVLGGRWVVRTLVDEAERRYYDPAAIRQEIEEIERRHQAGELDDATFENLEDSLLQRLLDAREYHQRKQAEGASQSPE